MVPLFYFYKGHSDNKRRLEIGGVFALLFFSLIFFQAMVVTGEYRGAFGGYITDSIGVYVGSFGLWVIWLMLIAVSMIIVLEQTLSELAFPFKEFMNQPLSSKPPKNVADTSSSQPDTDEEESYKNFNMVPSPVLPIVANTVEAPLPVFVQEESLIPESTFVPDEVEMFAVDEPLIQTVAKESTILSVAKKVKENKQQHAVVVEELEENKILLDQIDRGISEKPKNFKLPSTDFLQYPPKKQNVVDENELDDKIRDLIENSSIFGSIINRRN